MLVKRRTRDRIVASSSPGRKGGRIFFSIVNFVCLLSFRFRPTPMLPQWHVKDPGHSPESAGGRLHLNMHTPLTQWSRSGLTMPLSRHSVGPVRKRAHTQFVSENLVTVVSARWASVDWSWPNEWNKCVRELISTLKKKKRRLGMNCRTFSRNPRKRGKSYHHYWSFQLYIYLYESLLQPWYNR